MRVRGSRLQSPEHCPGYSVKLPQVTETVSLRSHWEKGHLREALGEDTPTPLLMALIELADSAFRGAESYFMKPAEERD